VAKICTFTAIRYFKAANEDGGHRTGFIYNRTDGRPVATTEPFDDGDCAGPRWVQVNLKYPVRPGLGQEYVVAIDDVMYYAKTEDYMFNKKTGYLRPSLGVYSYQSGYMPTTTYGKMTNFWVDGKSIEGLFSEVTRLIRS
jgi:hypothetical protein